MERTELRVSDQDVVPVEATTTDGEGDPSASRVNIVVVSYNTRELTLRCLRTVQESTHVPYHLVVFDNDSHDGSADAIEAEFPDVELIRSNDNLGFARANNVVSQRVTTEWLLLLNPDTEVFEGSLDALIEFGDQRPGAGIYGGRTAFPDGSLNIASCWNAISPYSAFCHAVGLTVLFPHTALFDREAIGSWQRDDAREVDVVVGCLLLIRTSLWRELGGFDEKYIMYGEEADLCLRAAKLGYRPAITPEATIMHLVGASSSSRADRSVMVAKARSTLIREHWPTRSRWWGHLMMYVWGGSRYAVASVYGTVAPRRGSAARDRWRKVWSERQDWLAGYR